MDARDQALTLVRSALCVALLVVLAGIAACSTPSLYEWGPYEDAVADITSHAGQVDVDGWIDRLKETVERARQEDRRIPPGLHAQLGMLYSMRGQNDTAAAAFETEMELFPESATFVRGMLARMKTSR